MAQTPLVDLIKTSELVLAEWDQRYNRAVIDVSAYDFTGVTNTPVSLCGWLIKTGDVLALAADAANVTGLILTDDKLSLNPTTDVIDNHNAAKFAKLVRGPALVRKNSINVTDTAGATIVIATVVTALAALNIIVLDDPPQTSTQGAH